MAGPGGYEVVRDPLWNNIGLDAQALAVLDTEPFQRLRYIRQLGHAFLVYPGATHTRFEHALGTYHLARRAMVVLRERGHLEGMSPDTVLLIPLAALLHDIGHYPFSHALEEAGLASHETLAREHLGHEELAAALHKTGVPDVESQITDLILGRSESPLQGLISGSLDLDKIEYLTRDARMCGVPYGTVDVDRLLHSLTIAGETNPSVGLHEKGVSALESLLFAKYQMYRNVYWHHAVRSATGMFKRLAREAIACGALDTHRVAHGTDDALMEHLHALPNAPLAARLRTRRLYKRVLDLPATAFPQDAGRWIAQSPDLVARVEDRLASELDLEPGELLIDFPAKPAMLSGDVPVLARDGTVSPARLSILGVAEELHAAARRMRVYTAHPISFGEPIAQGLVRHSAEEVERILEGDSVLAALIS